MIIKPDRQIITSAYGLPTAANFPFLKHYWPCDTANSSASSVLDIIGGCHITPSAFSTLEANSVNFSSTVADMAVAGSFFQGINTIYIPFVIGKFLTASGDIRFGTSTGRNFNLKKTSPTVTDPNTTNTAVATGTTYNLSTGGNLYGRALVVNNWNSATGLVTYETGGGNTVNTPAALAATTTAATATPTDALNDVTASTMLTGSGGFRIGNQRVFAMGIMSFATTLPSNFLFGLAQITEMANQGYKTMPPSWRGLS